MRHQSFKIVLILLLFLEQNSAECSFKMLDFVESGFCQFICSDIGTSDGRHPGHVAAEYAELNADLCPALSEWIALFISNSSFPGKTLDTNWFGNGTSRLKFNYIDFTNTNLASIDDGVFAAYAAFRSNIRIFKMENSPDFNRITDMLAGATSDLKFHTFTWVKNGVIKYVDTNLFSEIAPSIKEVGLDLVGFETDSIVAKLFGDCQTKKFENLQVLRITDSVDTKGLMYLSKKLFSAINSTNLIAVGITNAGLEYFEDSTAFDSFASPSITTILLDNNNLRTIPQGLFESIIKLDVRIDIDLTYNPWHCDCHLQYLQDTMNDNSNQLYFNFPQFPVTCVTPASQAGVEVRDADMNTECGPRVTPPPLVIDCVN